MHRYFALHKPYEVLSQFVGGAPGLRQLRDLGHDWPEGIHAVGRLDYQSEGLLLLTTDSSITARLFQSGTPHSRSYLVQAYKAVREETLANLREGVTIRIKGGGYHQAVPEGVEIIERPAWLLPIAHELRQDIPQSWLNISLTEGRYHQVRKMLRAVGHPVQRLVRTSIEALQLGRLAPGALQEYGAEEFFRLLRI